jgi:hypothetical protein
VRYITFETKEDVHIWYNMFLFCIHTQVKVTVLCT